MKFHKNHNFTISFAAALTASLLISAHFLRQGDIPFAVSTLIIPLFLCNKRRWAVNIAAMALLAGFFLWLYVSWELIAFRLVQNMPWLRLAAIMLAVSVFTLWSAWRIYCLRLQDRYLKGQEIAGTAAFLFIAFLLAVSRVKVSFPILIFDRIMAGSGILEILFLSSYGAWITELLIESKESTKIRMRIWSFFSLVFFGQLLLGFAGLDMFFMTGKLHIPVPAMIIGGPLYRGSGFFMPVLFLSTVVLAGPAWCSHLCYFGVWDNRAAVQKKYPDETGPWTKWMRGGTLVLVAATAIYLSLMGVSSFYAAVIGIGFGTFGLAVMVFLSWRKGYMVHCLSYCPIGLLAALLGKISPFRIKLTDSCTKCGLCSNACRYGALEMRDIKKRNPGYSCTLCGDCIGSCRNGAIQFKFLNMDHERARILFYIIVVSLHAAFLGLARI